MLRTTERSQTAVMRLDPGQASGDDAESHEGSDQVLLVLDGEVMAEVGEEKARLRKGDVVIVPADVPHRFRNEGAQAASTFSVYAPAAYPASGT